MQVAISTVEVVACSIIQTGHARQGTIFGLQVWEAWDRWDSGCQSTAASPLHLNPHMHALLLADFLVRVLLVNI
jgi:hypothetical protein